MAELATAKRETMTRKCACGEMFIGCADDEMCAVCYFKKESAPERRSNRAVTTRAEDRANLWDLAAKHSNIVTLHGYGCAKSRSAWAEFDAAVDRLFGGCMLTTKTRQEVTLPWPPKELSPNARVHWAKKSKHAKAYRMACFALCIEAKLEKPVTDGRLHLWIDFYPPDRRHRDDDNMVASFKNGRDGIADALGIDDKRFVCHPFVKDQIGGMVKFRITAGPEA